ncbi:hypothetical protein FAEPRAM212_01170 [Faecalibacterium prausnitzii M21/2]|uniref:Uncharacterized protein n=1 Tax=Faecalibacterium prausnitzii M21/2 TaxID=411485 RepID=A8S9X7_9FIRM|nr:hypothetical protein FAEPRAM212_01170 [Faecalibacterium prausnitzii M21/2]
MASQAKYHYILRFVAIAKNRGYFSGQNFARKLLTERLAFRRVISAAVYTRLGFALPI